MHSFLNAITCWSYLGSHHPFINHENTLKLINIQRGLKQELEQFEEC